MLLRNNGVYLLVHTALPSEDQHRHLHSSDSLKSKHQLNHIRDFRITTVDNKPWALKLSPTFRMNLPEKLCIWKAGSRQCGTEALLSKSALYDTRPAVHCDNADQYNEGRRNTTKWQLFYLVKVPHKTSRWCWWTKWIDTTSKARARPKLFTSSHFRHKFFKSFYHIAYVRNSNSYSVLNANNQQDSSLPTSAET